MPHLLNTWTTLHRAARGARRGRIGVMTTDAIGGTVNAVDLRLYAALVAGLLAGSLIHAQLGAGPVAADGAARLRLRIASWWLLAAGGGSGGASFGVWCLGAGDGWLAAAAIEMATLPLIVYLNRLSAVMQAASSNEGGPGLVANQARWTGWHGVATVAATAAFALTLVLLMEGR